MIKEREQIAHVYSTYPILSVRDHEAASSGAQIKTKQPALMPFFAIGGKPVRTTQVAIIGRALELLSPWCKVKQKAAFDNEIRTDHFLILNILPSCSMSLQVRGVSVMLLKTLA